MVKKLLQISILFSFSLTAHAQENSGYSIMRFSLGSSGSSNTVVTSKGTFNVSHSTGQGSVIGTHYNHGYYLRQGYQQPLSKIKMVEVLDYDLTAKIYPNPFTDGITISFSDTMTTDIEVLIFDINGKLIHSREFSPAQNLQLHTNDISNGTYFLKVVSKGKHFNAKLIKI